MTLSDRKRFRLTTREFIALFRDHIKNPDRADQMMKNNDGTPLTEGELDKVIEVPLTDDQTAFVEWSRHGKR